MRISDWSSDVCSSDLAFMPFLKDRAAASMRDVDEPNGQRNGDEGRDEERAQQSSHGDGPCPDHLGDVGDCRHHGAKDFSAGRRDFDALLRIEVTPVPQGRIELHSDELHAVLIELHVAETAKGMAETKNKKQ